MGRLNVSTGFALPLVAAASLLWATGQIVSAQVIHQFASVAVLWFWLLAVAGEGAAMTALPAVAVFSLALPIWEILMWPLQLAAAKASDIVTHIVGVQAVVSNEVIKLKWGTLVVAGSCSGLGFFLSAVTLACAYSTLFARTRSAQWRIIATAGLMAVLANWVRVVGLVLIANATRMTSPLMKDHELFGWGIFFAAMAIWFFVVGRFERAEPGDGISTHVNHADTPAFGRATKLASNSPWILPLATLMAASGPIFFYGLKLFPNIGVPPTSIVGITAGASFGPPQIVQLVNTAGGWRPGFVSPGFSRSTIWIVGTDTLRVDQLAYFEESQGSELIGAANRVAPDSMVLEERFVGPLDANMRSVRQAIVREGNRVRMVWYWYRVAGVETSSSGKAKLLSILAFIKREEGGVATFVSAPCREGDCRATTARLYLFVTGRPLPSSAIPGGG